MDELTEMIADAKAEEEVRAEQINKRIAEPKPSMVTIPLAEYNGLRDSYRDLSLIISVLMDDLEVDESGQVRYIDLYDKKDEILTILRRLYPNARKW